MQRRHFVTAALMLLAMAGAPALAQPIATAPPAQPAPDIGRIVRVDLETGAGKIILELYPDKAPITVANFLHYVNTKRFDGTHFFRAARAQGAPNIGLIQGVGFTDATKLYKPIAHEPTSQTGLHHGDGAISMAMEKPGSAQADFFIAVGDAPYLDADPAKGSPGYAMFGRVAEGMEVVHAILAMPTNGHARNPTMQGQILTDPVPIISAKVER